MTHYMQTISEVVVPLKLYTHFDELVEIHVYVQNSRVTSIKDTKGLEVDPSRFRVSDIKAMALQRLKDCGASIPVEEMKGISESVPLQREGDRQAAEQG